MDNTTKTITADELINKVASIVADLEDSLPPNNGECSSNCE